MAFEIEVAALAGVPGEVITRAKKILEKIEDGDVQSAHKSDKKEEESINQIGFADTSALEICDELKNMDVTTFTPIEAMNALYKLSEKAKKS